MEKTSGYYNHDLAIILSVSSILGGLGIVGNVLCVIVWTRQQMKSASAILLTLLAVTDTLIILFNIGSYSWPFFYYNPSMSGYFYDHIKPYVNRWLYPMFHTALTASTYLTLAITIERYIAVCFPFEYRCISTYSRSWKYAAVIINFSILFNLVRFWQVEVVIKKYLRLTPNNLGIDYKPTFQPTEFGRNPLFNSLYMGWMNLIICFLLPLATIMGVNIAIYFELMRARKACEHMTHSRKNNSGISTILMYVVAEFLVCTSIPAFFAISNCFHIDRYELGFDLQLLLPMSDILANFNASINFVTYITFGSRFRTAFLEIFRRRKIPNKAAGEIQKRNVNIQAASHYSTKDTRV